VGTPEKGPAAYFPSIEKKYGRPIADWVKLIRAHGPARHMELVSWLKSEYGLGHGHANALVGHALRQQ
jgi:glyoxylase-like metal-dependent hydrolase (beta-lactamase superfamily II)